MFAAYLAVTLLAAAVNGLAAAANLIGHEYPKAQADKLRLPRSWLLPLGTLLAASALGLLVGLAVPAVGTLAAGGLVLYFLGAFGAYLRVRDHQLGSWTTLSLAVAVWGDTGIGAFAMSCTAGITASDPRSASIRSTVRSKS